jgi:hypothetical protein
MPADAMLATVVTEGPDVCLAGSICWICRACGDIVTEPVAWRPFLTLLMAGVPLVEEETTDNDVDEPCTFGAPDGASSDPRTSSHPEHPLGGAAFTRDDELEMHELLSSETWFSDFVAQ